MTDLSFHAFAFPPQCNASTRHVTALAINIARYLEASAR
jgi:hypothetical protein